ncbi:TIGR04282 family arsenosugar biosynthesis glycosyltransferase [Echinicola marina]|uniref:TIGR04282 family arsenosugar biosynthesis glycosyltransferase n=1 Tax=Echinicola marina TaxID=2859768 RepID=UPI001CF62522|nr:TIGR04282 family arsenosugar biosynthesis glycosyltransferase [Echinicola marina]UCS94423.1 TIGR04282 family arsenosugar biosynthesis glycosyltransferase [Echinicola marina]
MNEHAIIIFQENPVPGKVKTRLGEVIGSEKAVEVYEYLLHHTHELVRDYPADVFVYFLDNVDEGYLLNDQYHLGLQGKGLLGERMQRAFVDVLSKGYEKVLFIRVAGTMELSNDILDEAFEALSYQDLVVGPAHDGTIYLLGMTKVHDKVFDHNDWKSDSLIVELTQEAKDMGLEMHKLPQLYEVEQYEDLKSLKGLLNIH